jgi:hypothetical protein
MNMQLNGTGRMLRAAIKTKKNTRSEVQRLGAQQTILGPEEATQSIDFRNTTYAIPMTDSSKHTFLRS